MLKLIYSISDKEITLKYHKRRSFWTKRLCKALAISVAAHLLIVGLFQIKALHPKKDIVLKPSRVITEMNFISSKMPLAKVNNLGFLQRKEPLLKHFVASNCAMQPFKEPSLFLEEELFFNDILSLGSHRPQSMPLSSLDAFCFVEPISLEFSSDLSCRVNNFSSAKKRVPLSSTESLHCKFDVEVNDKTGKIFYVRLLDSTGYHKYDQYAKKILKGLCFSPRLNSFSTKGHIDVLLEVEKRDIYD